MQGKVEKNNGETKAKRIKKVKKGKGKLSDDLSNMVGNSLTAVQSITSTIESDEADTEVGSESGDNHKPDTPKPNVSKLQLKSTSMCKCMHFVGVEKLIQSKYHLFQTRRRVLHHRLEMSINMS